VVPGGVQHRTMKRIAAIVLLLACALPASAAARTHRWRVSADVTGHYANDVTGMGRCAAHWQEAVTGLRMRLTATQPLAYDPQVPSLAGKLRFAVTAGRWSVTGSYVALAGQPDGTIDCTAPRRRSSAPPRSSPTTGGGSARTDRPGCSWPARRASRSSPACRPRG